MYILYYSERVYKRYGCLCNNILLFADFLTFFQVFKQVHVFVIIRLDLSYLRSKRALYILITFFINSSVLQESRSAL